MQFIDQILTADRKAFFMINHGLASDVLDFLMPILRNQYTWIPVYVLFAVIFVRNFGRKGIYLILFGLLTFAISDQLSSTVLKSVFIRIRPCNDGDINQSVRLLVNCGAGFSFPSSHATNHFAFSLFLICVLKGCYRWIIPFALIWAALVCIAQVYVGVHYPLDVTGGAFFGSIVGLVMGLLSMKIIKPDSRVGPIQKPF
jgi:undecaprenyl-diphosphatase